MQNLLATHIADLALNTFTSLPTKCKPRTLADGSREWTPMSAVALNHSSSLSTSSAPNGSQLHGGKIQLISLATGTKSLPVSALPKCKGLVLHDCHAEILALRGLNYWLLTEVERLLSDDEYESQWLEVTSSTRSGSTSQPPFRFRQGVELSLFSTEAPCGDASMELLMAASEAAGRDISPWPTAATHKGASSISEKALPLGRGCFSDLGALRRKPARADAEISMSKSCTDKLMLKQFTGLLGFPLDLLIQHSPETFLRRFIVYREQYSEEGYARAFGPEGRLKTGFASKGMDSDVLARFFEVCTLPSDFRRFGFEKQKGMQEVNKKSKVSNTSALWIAGGGSQQSTAVVEVLVNGVKQGFKQFDEQERKGSVTCRRTMIQKAVQLQRLVQIRGMAPADFDNGLLCDYSRLKSSHSRGHKKDLKQLVLASLGGWPKEYPKDEFEIDRPPLQCSNGS